MSTTALPKTVWAFIWHYLRDKRLMLAGEVLVALVWAVELTLTPYLIKLLVDAVVVHANDYPVLMKAILWPAIGYVSMSLMINLNFRLYDYLQLRMYPAIKAQMTSDMFNYLLSHSYGFFQNNFAGTLTKKIFDMITNAEQVMQIVNEWYYPRALALIIASAALWKIVHPVFGIVVFVWTVLFIYGSYLVSKHSETYAKTVFEAYSSMSGLLSDSVSNVVSTKLFFNASYESFRVRNKLNDLVNADRRLLWFNLKSRGVQGLAVALLSGILLYFLIQGVKQKWVTAGDFAMVLSLTSWLVNSIWDIGRQMLELSKAVGACQQALSFIVVPHEIVDAPDAKTLVVPQGEIAFKQVSYAYIDNKPIFKDLNLIIHPGEKVGLVGYSGGGKSTFMKLILRLMDIRAGAILIDDQNIAQVTHESLRRNIGTIPQETELFHRTVMENIRFAKPEASDEEVIEASIKACCDEFIRELPEGYNALVGERGVKLSGGQKQRIAIARAFLKNAPILLLDEATSALDTVTERLIQTSLHKIMQGKTTIVIAHRLSTLKDMDRILFFDNGVIVEQGTLHELLADPNGKFSQLWQMQSEGFIAS